jgi:hypothetical protein
MIPNPEPPAQVPNTRPGYSKGLGDPAFNSNPEADAHGYEEPMGGRPETMDDPFHPRMIPDPEDVARLAKERQSKLADLITSDPRISKLSEFQSGLNVMNNNPFWKKLSSRSIPELAAGEIGSHLMGGGIGGGLVIPAADTILSSTPVQSALGVGAYRLGDLAGRIGEASKLHDLLPVPKE